MRSGAAEDGSRWANSYTNMKIFSIEIFMPKDQTANG